MKLLIIALVIAAASATNVFESRKVKLDRVQQWKLFKQTHKKSYSNIAEETARYIYVKKKHL